MRIILIWLFEKKTEVVFAFKKEKLHNLTTLIEAIYDTFYIYIYIFPFYSPRTLLGITREDAL